MFSVLLCCPGPASVCCKELLLGNDKDDVVPLEEYTPYSSVEDVWRPKVVFEDGRSYEGQWQSQMRHGHGKEVSKYGDFVYEGSFKKDQYDGEGSMRWSNGARYTGQFLSNEKHGDGTEIYSTGESFTGKFKHGMIHGKGEYFFLDQPSIKGIWKDGVLVEELSSIS